MIRSPSPGKGELRIRPMAVPDLDRVIAIEGLSFSHPWTHDQFKTELDRPAVSRCYVAAMDSGEDQRDQEPGLKAENIVGYIMAWLVADECHITNLAVLPEARRCGVAGALLQHSLAQARKEGAVWCQLEVRFSNTAARELYGRWGFKNLGLRKRYYADGEDAVVMGKELGAGEQQES